MDFKAALPTSWAGSANHHSGWAEAPGCDLAPQVRALPGAVCHSVFTALCPQAAAMRLSGWAEAPGCDFAPQVRALPGAVCASVFTALCPQAAAMRLGSSASSVFGTFLAHWEPAEQAHGILSGGWRR